MTTLELAAYAILILPEMNILPQDPASRQVDRCFFHTVEIFYVRARVCEMLTASCLDKKETILSIVMNSQSIRTDQSMTMIQIQNNDGGVVVQIIPTVADCASPRHRRQRIRRQSRGST